MNTCLDRKFRAYRRSLRLAKEQRRQFRRRLSISIACEDSLCEQLMLMDGANHELEADASQALAVLRAVEWSYPGEECPVCHEDSREPGHAPECALDAVKKQLQRREG